MGVAHIKQEALGVHEGGDHRHLVVILGQLAVDGYPPPELCEESGCEDGVCSCVDVVEFVVNWQESPHVRSFGRLWDFAFLSESLVLTSQILSELLVFGHVVLD